MTMRARNAAMMAAGWAALGSATVSALVIWLVLARPQDVVDAARGNDVAGLVTLAFETVRGLLTRLLELL
jgi:hypothetical protein